MAKRHQVNNIIQKTKTDTYDKKAIRVTRQVPTEIRQNSAKLYHIASILKEMNPDVYVTVKDGKVMVNGVTHKSPLAPPTLQEILQVTHEEIKVLHNINFYASDAIQEKGSTFRALATPIVNKQDARLAYRAMSRFPGTSSATHLIAAYMDISGEFEYYDDGDHGLGKFVFDMIYDNSKRGIMVFMSRDYGGRHLGAMRYEIVQNVVDQAMDKMAAAIARNPKLANPANLQMQVPSTPQHDEQAEDVATHQQDQQPSATGGIDESNENVQMEIDSTKHKQTYPGTPINKNEGPDDFKTPPPSASANERNSPFFMVDYNKSKSKKTQQDSSISLGQAVAGGDAFSVMMANKVLRAGYTEPNRGKRGRGGRGRGSGRGRGDRGRGGNIPGMKQITSLKQTNSNTRSPKRDAVGQTKA
jgi:hypothetical protein